MLKILIVDDDPNKIKKITEVIFNFSEINNESVDIESDLIGARKNLIMKTYDLMILDLQLPERFGDDARNDAGLEFLYEIKKQKKFIKPYHIIGLTAYNDLKLEYQDKFINELWVVLHFEIDSINWAVQLENKIKYLLDSKKTLCGLPKIEYDFDIAIITALPKIEMGMLLKIEANWKKYQFGDDSTVYHQGIFQKGNKTLKVVAACAPQMGMIASSVLSVKIINRYRPKYICIIGIAAGVEDDGNYGDILIADQTWDYGNGKINIEDGNYTLFSPDPKNIQLDSTLKEKFQAAQIEKRYVSEIRESWLGKKPKNVLDVIIGPFASGSFVVNNKSVIDLVKSYNRKLIGIDMETYGVFYAAANCCSPRPKAFSIKSISDFGNNKTDDFQNYASFVSAQYLYNFAVDELTI